jgi:hypothetical protein
MSALPPTAPVRESLRALVRSRRIERALAAARALPRPPFMRTSISFLTTTSAIAPRTTAVAPHVLEVLGFDRDQRTIYFQEDLGGATPLVHLMHTDGEHAGRMTVAHSLYAGAKDEVAARVADRVAALRTTLEPLDAIDSDAYLLTTRVIQRRALRVTDGPPIRKFTLMLSVEPLVGDQPAALAGKTAVTAYLRARAALDRVWLVPRSDLAIARVTYLGVPSEIGHDKQVAVLTARAA